MSNISSIRLTDPYSAVFGNFGILKEILFNRLNMSQQSFNHPNRQQLLEIKGRILPPKPSKNGFDSDPFVDTQNIFAVWFQRQFGDDVLSLLQNGMNFEYEPNEFSRVEVIVGDASWAFRAHHPSGDGHIYFTEASLLQKRAKGPVDLHISRGFIYDHANPLLSPRIPEFSGRIAAEQVLVDSDVRLGSHLNILTEKPPVDKLASFINSPTRQQPVIIFVPPEVTIEQRGSQSDEHIFRTHVLPLARLLAEQAAGVAHAFVIGGGHDSILRQKLGDDFSVNPGEIRIFPPYEKPDRPIQMRHALSRAAYLNPNERWNNFRNGLLSRLTNATYHRGSAKAPSPFLALQKKLAPPSDPIKQRQIAAEQAFEALIEISDRFDELVSVQNLRGDVDNLAVSVELRKHLERLRELKDVERSGELDSIFQDTIEKGIKIRAGFTAAAYGITKPYEEKYEALTAWIHEHFSGRIVLTESAQSILQDPKKAKYHDINLIYAAVELLATHYYGMKTLDYDMKTLDYDMKTLEGKAAKFHRAIFENRLKKLHLEDTPSLTATTRKQFQDEYTATVDGEQIKLERHLKRGNSPDPTESVRIYYAWDDKRKRVVIGSLAGHKRNRLTT